MNKQKHCPQASRNDIIFSASYIWIEDNEQEELEILIE